ncbi:hypothetical protein [Acidianus brierleyi]|nr:hypothetical protein [Acidianus brierleyi]
MDRSTLYRYISSKVKKVPDDVVDEVAEMLSLEELSDTLYGFKQ